MDLTADFKAYQERVTSSLVDVTRTASQVSSQDLSFHRSSSEKVSKALDNQNTHLLRLTSKLLKAATKESNIKAPVLQDQDSIEDNWRGIVDVVDDLLEKADASLDEFTGVIKRLSPAVQDGAQTPPLQARPLKGAKPWSKPVHQKPQLLFDRQVNNYETRPFKPLLRTKPHAIVPLEESIGEGKEGYIHPYAVEIEKSSYPESAYEISPPIHFTPPNESRAIFVDTEEGVQDMLGELKSANEIAIDLEHNDRRSYVGIVCLMQVSTRDKDWIVDTLQPWRENLQVLNEVFADPNVIKVFHGSSMDMIWLQRDLGLYIVGLFDTYHACCALQFPGRGLKYLLQRFANFEAQKQYQLADWRVRPLPEELIDYARSDTHYLLYIYDNLRNMLIEASTPNENLIDQVMVNSKAEALQVYERPIYDRDSGRGSLGWFGMLMSRSTRFDNEQFGVFKAVHEWRDQKAREWDEGVQFIMPNAAVWAIAEAMPLYMAQLYQCCRPMPKPVADNAKELLDVIKQGKDLGREGPSMREIIQSNEEKYGPYKNRWRREKKEPESTYTGLGATLQQLSQSGEIGNQPGPADMHEDLDSPVVTRSSASSLWGNVGVGGFTSLTTAATAAAAALRGVLPLPALSETSFKVAGQVPVPVTPAAASEPDPQDPVTNGVTQGREKQNDIFILKELSIPKKRKAEHAVDITEEFANLKSTNPTSSPETPQEADFELIDANGTEAHQFSKQQKKAAKRAKKMAKKAEAAAKAAQPVVPFDYANAESLLKPQNESGLGSANGIKPMNPFAKALDTSTGAKRNKMGKELAGKSHTFRS